MLCPSPHFQNMDSAPCPYISEIQVRHLDMCGIRHSIPECEQLTVGDQKE